MDDYALEEPDYKRSYIAKRGWDIFVPAPSKKSRPASRATLFFSLIFRYTNLLQFVLLGR